ncbi:MAG: hypothetical protein WCV90_07780 [Candidatus Woesearchaeota archaeon]|jgi:hypothetical protein
MNETAFLSDKRKVTLTDKGLYQPGNPSANHKTGIIELDSEISDLVLDINRLPFALTGPTCQGHFRYKHYVDDHRGVIVDFDGQDVPVVGFLHTPLSKAFRLPGIDDILLEYNCYPNLTLEINEGNPLGNEFGAALIDWERAQEGRVFINHGDKMTITVIPRELYDNRDRKYTLTEARELNQLRISGLASLHEVVKAFTLVYGVESSSWEKAREKFMEGVITVNRQGRIPKGMTPENDAVGYECKTQPIPLDIAITPVHNGKMIVHIPGFLETVNGYGNKYQTLANLLQQKSFAAMVRMDNRERDYHPLEETLFDDLRFVINYALAHAKEICGTDNPELYLMSFSGGANALGVLAPEYPQVKKMLMMGPAIECHSPIQERFSHYKGELYIVQGENDWVLNGEGGRIFHRLASRATRRELVIIPDCEHFFKHKDEVYSKAPFWAFGGDTTFPDPEGGIKLVQ